MTAVPSQNSQSRLEVATAPAGWHRHSAASPPGEQLPTDLAVYGTDIPTEGTLRLLGDLAGKRVLDLGCGAGHGAVTFARQGAKVIAVDPSAAQIDAARSAAEAAEVKVELQHAGLAELAFVRADTLDAVFSSYALAEVADLNRVFRQVHRVLKPECPIVFSLPHPAFAMFDPQADDPSALRRGYHDATPIGWRRGEEDVLDHPRTISEVFTSLIRANFRVDTVLEPDAGSGSQRSAEWAELMSLVPPTVIFRARKHGT